jgi:hypothetical protein
MMTMSLVGPWLSTTGKRRGKQKFRNAEQAAKARMNEESWKELQKRWGIEEEDRKRDRALKAKPYVPPQPYRRDTGPRAESKPDTVGIAVRAPDKVYTGDAMIGIGQLHKSNAIPVFKQEDAADIAKMRR